MRVDAARRAMLARCHRADGHRERHSRTAIFAPDDALQAGETAPNPEGTPD